MKQQHKRTIQVSVRCYIPCHVMFWIRKRSQLKLFCISDSAYSNLVICVYLWDHHLNQWCLVSMTSNLHNNKFENVLVWIKELLFDSSCFVKKSYRLWSTWGWEKMDRILILGQTSRIKFPLMITISFELGMHDIGFLPISDTSIFFNSFLSIPIYFLLFWNNTQVNF